MELMEATRRFVAQRYQLVDPEVGLIKSHCIPNYHSNLKPGEYHFIKSSVDLALLTFAVGDEPHYHAANEMLCRAIAMQCRTGECAGVWPYYLEETLEEMVAPDWNYADFNALPIITILKEYGDKLEPGTYDACREACLYACRAIQKRNLTVLYTNPTVSSVYILALCAELFDRPDLMAYAKHKLNKFYYMTMKDGTYNEYNCPGYTKLILEFYSIILRNVTDPEILEKVTTLNDLAWTMLGEHYHHPTGEFTGPKFRQYVNFLAPDERVSWTRAVGPELDLLTGDEGDAGAVGDMDIIYDVHCPPYLRHYYTDPEKTTAFRRILSYGFNYPYLGWPLVDTQYAAPAFTLGSYNGMDGWNQHHNVVAYIGTRRKKVCIRMRVYHDGYDYASAYMNTAQEKGTAVTVVNFHTDRGDTHHDLDPVKNAQIKAKDFRVRYQLQANVQGVIDSVTVQPLPNGCRMDVLGIPVEIQYHAAEFTGERPYFEIVREDNSLFVDMVLYHGEEKVIRFDDLAALVTVSHLSVGETLPAQPTVSIDNGFIRVGTVLNGLQTEIIAPIKPLPQRASVLADEVRLDGRHIMKYVEETED